MLWFSYKNIYFRTMLLDGLIKYDIYSPTIIIILVIAGFLVGFINTLAGSGTIISYSVFMALGLPPSYANGTIRVGVIMQTLASSFMFKKGSFLDVKKGLSLAFPTVIGSIVGAQIAIDINQVIFNYLVGGAMFLMLIFLVFKPQKWIAEKEGKGISLSYHLQFIIYLLIGVYGGFIHIGVGIFLLAALVLISGYDLLRANALKVFIVLMYSPFALFIYMYNDHVQYGMALISSIGNVLGGMLASRLAMSWGSQFIHWVLLVVIILFTAKTFGLLDYLM